MNLLAFDTSTETLRLAVQKHGHAALEREAAGGAQASVSLIPAVRALLSDMGLRLRDLDAIVYGRGPGSFTGLRTACAVAQGLGFGANVPVLGVDTLLAVAEDAHFRLGVRQLVAVLDARMQEVYWAAYSLADSGWQAHGAIALGRPADVENPGGWALAGNAFAAYPQAWPGGAALMEAAPTATAMLRLAPGLIAAGQAQPADRAMPVYIRDKVAQTTEERAALRAAQAAKP